MNIYRIKWSGKDESLHHVNEYSLSKNEQLIWSIRSFYGFKYYEIDCHSGLSYVMQKRHLFSRSIDLLGNGKRLFSLKGKAIQLPAMKLWLDSRDFVYLNDEKLCSIDLQRRDWEPDENVVLKWEHSKDQLETEINMLALYVLKVPTWSKA